MLKVDRSKPTIISAWAIAKTFNRASSQLGKLITENLGLVAASLALRHTSPTVTATYYADDTRPKHTDLGKLIPLSQEV